MDHRRREKSLPLSSRSDDKGKRRLPNQKQRRSGCWQGWEKTLTVSKAKVATLQATQADTHRFDSCGLLIDRRLSACMAETFCPLRSNHDWLRVLEESPARRDHVTGMSTKSKKVRRKV